MFLFFSTSLGSNFSYLGERGFWFRGKKGGGVQYPALCFSQKAVVQQTLETDIRSLCI